MTDSVKNLFSVTEVDLVYRSKTKASDRLKITSADEAYDVFLSAWDKNKIELCEQFMIMLLNRGSYCLGVSLIATGGVSTCIADPKIIFATALKAKASSIVLAHNHPSTNTKPSQLDIDLTRKLRDGGRLLDITIFDHLIITPQSFYSFANKGLVL